jgi:hypothetical protein
MAFLILKKQSANFLYYQILSNMRKIPFLLTILCFSFCSKNGENSSPLTNLNTLEADSLSALINDFKNLTTDSTKNVMSIEFRSFAQVREYLPILSKQTSETIYVKHVPLTTNDLGSKKKATTEDFGCIPSDEPPNDFITDSKITSAQPPKVTNSPAGYHVTSILETLNPFVQYQVDYELFTVNHPGYSVSYESKAHTVQFLGLNPINCMYIEDVRGSGDVYKYGEVTTTVTWKSCLRMKAFTLRAFMLKDIIAKIP